MVEVATPFRLGFVVGFLRQKVKSVKVLRRSAFLIFDFIFYIKFVVSALAIYILKLFLSEERVLSFACRYLYPASLRTKLALKDFESYVEYFPSNLDFIPNLLNDFRWGEGMNILDAGSGLGQYSALLAKNADSNVVGLEFQRQKETWASQKWQLPNLKFVQGSIYEIPFETSTFDIVFSYTVFEHLNSVEKALGEIFRVLKSKGRAIIVFQYVWHRTGHHLVPYISVPWAFKLFSEEALCRYFTQQIKKEKGLGRGGFFESDFELASLGEGAEFSLNFLDPKEFESYLPKFGFEILKAEPSETIAQLVPVLKNIRGLGKYLAGSVTYILQKP